MPTITFPSVTRTSVTISFTQPKGSLLADNYTVILMQILNSSNQMCDECQNRTNTTDRDTTMISYSNLSELSTFNVTVTAGRFGESRTSMEQFVTRDSTVSPPAAGKCHNEMMTNFPPEF